MAEAPPAECVPAPVVEAPPPPPVHPENPPPPPPTPETHCEQPAPPPPETIAAPEPAKVETSKSLERDINLAKVKLEKSLADITAWEENEKTKSQNKYTKKVSEITVWEDERKAAIEAKLKSKEQALEKKRAALIETCKNKIAEIHKLAEEKKSLAESERATKCLQIEETAAKCRASGKPLSKGCFGA